MVAAGHDGLAATKMKRPILCTAILLVGLSSCDKKREIRVYAVEPKSEGSPHGETLPAVDPVAADPEADPHAGMPVLAAPLVKDEPPAHWIGKKRTAMRMASYGVEGPEGQVADISFTSLRSAPGSLWANLNRWRDQVGLPGLSDAELKESSPVVSSFFGDALLIDVEGLLPGADPKQDGRIIGAIAEKDGRAWFYKMRGNAELVGKEKENFIRWIPTLHPTEEVEPVAPRVTLGDLDWSLPNEWKALPGSDNRYATIRLTENGPDLVVSNFPGDVGGDLANVNRWRSQVGMPGLAEAELAPAITTLEAGPKAFKCVEIAGPQQSTLAAWVRHGENTWFFKLSADASTIAANKESFLQFIRSIRFNLPE